MTKLPGQAGLDRAYHQDREEDGDLPGASADHPQINATRPASTPDP